jgi:hypothetical protein
MVILLLLKGRELIAFNLQGAGGIDYKGWTYLLMGKTKIVLKDLNPD